METLAPGERSREGQRTEETSIEARRTEEQEEEGSTAPMLGKFGVTRGDEDEREREREEEVERDEREEEERETKREFARRRDHRPQGWTGDR